MILVVLGASGSAGDGPFGGVARSVHEPWVSMPPRVPALPFTSANLSPSTSKVESNEDIVNSYELVLFIIFQGPAIRRQSTSAAARRCTASTATTGSRLDSAAPASYHSHATSGRFLSTTLPVGLHSNVTSSGLLGN
jgi:hypothetical protein